MKVAKQSEANAGASFSANVGDVVKPLELTTIHGKLIKIPDPKLKVHLQFRRFAGCPVCNLHIRSFLERRDDLAAAGLMEVIVFYSDAKTALEIQGQLPFPAIADPTKELYGKFGADRRMGAYAVLVGVLRALYPRTWLQVRSSRRRGENQLGLPSEFLIGSDGRILAAKRGKHVNDHWSVEQVIKLAGRP